SFSPLSAVTTGFPMMSLALCTDAALPTVSTARTDPASDRFRFRAGESFGEDRRRLSARDAITIGDHEERDAGHTQRSGVLDVGGDGVGKFVAVQHAADLGPIEPGFHRQRLERM